jgi:hypothetical protein
VKTVWDDLFDEDILSGMNADLRSAQRVADKQAFGMVRLENTDEFIRIMNKVRTDIERIVKRVEATKLKGGHRG